MIKWCLIVVQLVALLGAVNAQVAIPVSTQVSLKSSASHLEHSLLLLVDEEFDSEEVIALGGVVGTHIGDVVTLRIAGCQIENLRQIRGVKYLQMANKIAPNLKKAIPDLRADSVYSGEELVQGYTGKDVIIGVTDWGFDYTHPMFYDTALQHTRILAAWDQFKQSGPHPDGYDYGTEYVGEAELLAAEKDTLNIYGYATHGTHVAGIAGGSGAGTEHRGVAYEADFLFATFLVDEAAVIDALYWMKEKAAEYNKRLVVNMSWGLYNIGPLDGTSLVSRALDLLSEEGVIFVTSGGNNGDVKFHIKHSFSKDTIQSRVEFYGYGSNPHMWGQSISMWGESGKHFTSGFTVYDRDKNIVGESPFYSTVGRNDYLDSFLVIGADTIRYNFELEGSNPLNNNPHTRLRIQSKNTSLRIGLKAYAEDGDVHFYNVTELTTDVGNWGMPFSAFLPGWVEGDAKYSLGEPASTRSVITVAAHGSETFTSQGIMGGGFIADFSSEGPTIDGRMKPDVSAPGVNVASSVSSFTNRSFTLLENVSFKGKNYPFSRFSGTSMSSPATAGVVALMLQANPNLYADEAKVILHNTAREDIRTGILPKTGDLTWGWGKVNSYAAVKASEYKFANVDDLESINDLLLKPNPATSVLFLNTNEPVLVEISSLEGKVLLIGEMSSTLGIDVKSLKSGVYFLKVRGGETADLKFVKL